MYVVDVREWYYISLICIFKKDIMNFEVKGNVQNMALRFRGKFDNQCFSYIQVSSMVVIWL